MADEQLTLAYEANLAEWWEAHILANGGTADRSRGLDWSLDKHGGGSSMHRVRLDEAGFDGVISRCLDEAAPYGSAVWAYVSDHATPADAIERFRAAGFQHNKRFDVFIHRLDGLEVPALKQGVTIERLTGLDRFSKQVPHPYVGPVTTPARKQAIAAEQSLIQSRPDEFISYLLSVNGEPVSTVTVLVTDDMAGIYNVGTVEAARGQGHAGTLLNYALDQARQAGAQAAGLIAVAKAEALYERIGFRPEGWISWLYYSKIRMAKRVSA